MHTNKEAKKPHVLLIVQMDFGENMRVFLHRNYQQFGSLLLCLLKVKFWCIKNEAGEIPLASKGSNLEG